MGAPRKNHVTVGAAWKQFLLLSGLGKVVRDMEEKKEEVVLDTWFIESNSTWTNTGEE